MQLVELQEAQPRFAALGLGLAAVTYDNEATLREFATAHDIRYPLLADPQSSIIRAYRVLDPDNGPENRPDYAMRDMAYPGYFFIDRRGIVREKSFEGTYFQRRTPGALLAQLFPQLVEAKGEVRSRPHLRARTGQSDLVAGPGNRVTLFADVELPPGVHVYAPSTKGYRGIELTVASDAPCEILAALYPPPTLTYLRAIHARVPVIAHRFRVSRDVRVPAGFTPEEHDFLVSVRDSPEHTKVVHWTGVLRYQACDERTCYPPAELPLAWELGVELRKMSPRAAPENQRKEAAPAPTPSSRR